MMTWAVSIITLAAIAYGVYSGYRRGLALICLELASFGFATLVALLAYHPVGAVLKPIFGVNTALANVSAFIIVWTVTEIFSSLMIHRKIIHHVAPIRDVKVNQYGGAVAGGFKTAAIITLILVVYAGLPIPSSTKRPVTDGPVAGVLLAASGDLRQRMAVGLGRDINDGFDFFTITAEPKSETLIELGYSTTDVTVDSHAEAAMLDLVNNARKEEGLEPLTVNIKARAVARKYSAAMFEHGFFSHIDNENHTPFDRMQAGDVAFTIAGENLALAPTYMEAFDGLMKSPEHRANILSPDFRTVGIGVVDGGEYGLMVTQNFTD